MSENEQQKQRKVMKKQPIIPFEPAIRRFNNDHIPELERLLSELPANQHDYPEITGELMIPSYKEITEQRTKQMQELINSMQFDKKESRGLPRKKKQPISTDRINKRKLVYNMGKNDADYNTAKCPFYIRWRKMLQDCYSKENRSKGKTVHDNWLRFSSFRRWMKKQDYKGNVMSHTILNPDSLRYSPDTVCFIPKYLLSLMNMTNEDLVVRLKRDIKERKHYYYSVYLRQINSQDRKVHHRTIGEIGTFSQAVEIHNDALALYLHSFIKEDTHPHIVHGLRVSIRTVKQFNTDIDEIK